MGRVSLTEDYDDRSVIAKLNEMDKRVKENAVVVTSAEASAKASAQAAQETADRFAGSVGAVVQNANAQINASKAQVDQAKAEVDATVTTVAQAVQTANDASASAQQSATTVAGYDTRLTEAETKNTQQDTAISELQTADGQNVKLGTTQTITGNKTFTKTLFTKRSFNFDATSGNQWGGEIQMNSENTRVGVVENFVSGGNLDLQLFSQNPISNKYGSMGIHLSRDGKTNYCFGFNPTANAPSNAFATKGYVESTDGVTNNILHRGTTEVITNQKLGMVNGSSRGTNLSSRTLAIGEIQGSVIAEEYIQIGYVYTDRSGMIIGYYEGTPSSVVKNNTHVLTPLISHQKIGIIKQDGKYLLCISLSRAYSVFPTVNVMYCGSAYNPLEVVMYKTPAILDVTYDNFTGGAEIS